MNFTIQRAIFQAMLKCHTHKRNPQKTISLKTIADCIDSTYRVVEENLQIMINKGVVLKHGESYKIKFIDYGSIVYNGIAGVIDEVVDA